MFIRSRASLIVLASACALGLAACAAPATLVPETITATPPTTPASATPLSEADAMLTTRADGLATLHAQETVYALTPTVTPHPPQTYAPPTPTPVFGSGAVGDDFLFGNQPPGCELPCWQGLSIGESDAGDIQNVFDITFGFSGSYDLLRKSRRYEDLPGLVVVSSYWDFAAGAQGPSPEGFGAAFVFHDDTRIPEAITLAGISQRFERFTSPQLILRELGTPSYMLARIGMTEDAYKSSGGLMIIYDNGITITYPAILLSVARPELDAPGIAKLCLGTLPSNTGHYWVEVDLTGPLLHGLNDLSPIQEDMFGNTITKTTPLFRPFEEVFGLSPEEVTKLAQQQQNPCVYTDVP